MPREQADVAADADEQAAALQPMTRIGLHWREDAGALAGRPDAGDRIVDRGAHVRMGVVARMAECGGEVARPDEEPIDTVDGGNRLDVGDRGCGFDLHDHADLVVGARGVVLDPPEAIRAHRRRDPSNPGRGIPGGGHRALRFLRRLHEGNDEALHPDVQQPLEDHGVVPRRPDDRARRPFAHRLELAQHQRQLVGRVLGVDQHPVEAGSGDDFRGHVARQAAPQPNLHVTFAERFLQSIDRQRDFHGQ